MVEIFYRFKKKTLISRPLKWCRIDSDAQGMTVNTFFKHVLYCLQNIMKLPAHAIDAKHASNGVSYSDTTNEKTVSMSNSSAINKMEPLEHLNHVQCLTFSETNITENAKCLTVYRFQKYKYQIQS